jgi:CRP-like cAMP-binding protein
MISPEILKTFRLFDGLDNAELRSLSAIADQLSFERGAVIFTENTPAHALYLLLDGWVDILINTDAQGSRRELVTILTCGDLFGWSALIKPHVYAASAVCASPVKAIQMEGADLRRLFEFNNTLRSLIIERICQMIAAQLRAARVPIVKLSVTD